MKKNKIPVKQKLKSFIILYLTLLVVIYLFFNGGVKGIMVMYIIVLNILILFITLKKHGSQNTTN